MMKMIFWFCLTLFCNGIVYSQPITGLGGITIGMSETEFLALPEINAKHLKDAGTQSYKDTKSVVIYKQTLESKGEYVFSQIFTPEHTNYEFQIPIGIKKSYGDKADVLFNVSVEIYKEKVYEVKVDILSAYQEVEKLLIEKYGAPKETGKMKTVTCQNGYGAKTEHNDGTGTVTWGDKSEVTAEIRTTFSQCSKYISINYLINHKKTKELVAKLEDTGRRDAKAAELKAKAGSSKL